MPKTDKKKTPSTLKTRFNFKKPSERANHFISLTPTKFPFSNELQRGEEEQEKKKDISPVVSSRHVVAETTNTFHNF